MQSPATRALILASTSRYRHALLERLQLPFTVQAPGVNETPLAGEAPAALASRLALAKAAAVADAAPHATEALRELAHARGAQEIWLSRIEGRPATIPVWPAYSAVELARMGTIIDARMRRLFATLMPDALLQEIAYTNLEGLPSRTALGEILLPLLMHAHDHRGQANVAL